MAAGPGGAPLAAMPLLPPVAKAGNTTRRTVLLVAAVLAALVLVGSVAIAFGTALFGSNITAADVRDWPEYKQPMYNYAVRLPAEPTWEAPRLIGPVKSFANCRSCEHQGCSIGLSVWATEKSPGGPRMGFSYTAAIAGVCRGTDGKVVWQGEVKCAGQTGYGYTIQAGDRYFSGRMFAAFPSNTGPVYYALEFNDYQEGDKEAVDEYFASFRFLD